MAFAKYPPENISEAITVFKQDVELAHGIVHGDENTEVLTEKGLVPSFSKVINTFEVQGQQVISEFGWTQVGTFAAGFTFTSPNQVGQDIDGNWWRWNDAFPKVVTAGTLPISDANYKLVGDGVLRSDLAAVDSTVLVGGVTADDLARKYQENVSLKDYAWLAVGDDWTAALAAAASVANTIKLPEGLFKFNSLNLPSNTRINGSGYNTVVMPLTAGNRCALGSDSGSASTFIENLTFNNLRFLGTVAADGFAEQCHLLALNGASSGLVRRCWFEGFRGDGIYLGSGNIGGQERHNRDITVKKCVFDGINNDNRNGISIIDGDGVLIVDNVFRNCTRFNMPGAIDIEPDSHEFHVVRNITIRDNKFKNIGGNVGAIAFFLPGVTYTTPPENFIIEGNKVDTCTANGFYFSYNVTGGISASTNDFALTLSDNRFKNCVRPFSVNNIKSATIIDNIAKDCIQDALIGFNTANDNVIGLTIKRNKLIRCGSVSGNGMSVFKCSRVDIEDNEFNDCGSGAPGAANALVFGAGTSSSVNVSGNKFLSPTGKTLIAIQKEAVHAFTPATNKLLRNDFGGLPFSSFEAHENDAGFTLYTPVVEGGGTEGGGTYTRQFGRWRRFGKQVFFDVEIVQTAHTGTGVIEISLPVAPLDNIDSTNSVISIAIDGAATAGGQVGIINPLAAAGGVTGSVRCFHTGSGALAQTAVPAGAATYRASGTYMAA